MHQLFTIKDLIFQICSFMTLGSLSAAARVSSDWFWCAVPYLYKDVVIRQALSPLGEIRYQYHFSTRGHYRFVNPPGDKEWKRFLMYARYVRILNVNEYHECLFAEVISKCQSAGVQYLFPDLRSLKWNMIPFTHSQVFSETSVSSELADICSGLISPDINHLDLLIYDRPPLLLQHIGQLLTTRLAALRFLEIDLTPCIGIDSKPIQDLLNSFARTLESVTAHIPLRLIADTDQWQYLLRTPSLQNLIVHAFGVSFDETLTIRESYVQYNNTQIRTSHCRSLFFGASLECLNGILNSSFDFTSLTMFSWHLDVNFNDVAAFMAIIVNVCPRMQSLILGAPRKRYCGRLFQPPEVPWSSIQPIVQCKELTRLSLNCIRVSMDLEQLTTFLKNRTTWTHLDIFTSPYILHLHDILLYAKYCPNLTHLGTSINTGFRTTLENLRPPGSPTFPVLTSIDVARTIFLAYSEREIGQFLYEICEKPPYIRGYNMETCHAISKHIASCYVGEETKTEKPMSPEAREYVKKIREYKPVRRMPSRSRDR